MMPSPVSVSRRRGSVVPKSSCSSAAASPDGSPQVCSSCPLAKSTYASRTAPPLASIRCTGRASTNSLPTTTTGCVPAQASARVASPAEVPAGRRPAQRIGLPLPQPGSHFDDAVGELLAQVGALGVPEVEHARGQVPLASPQLDHARPLHGTGRERRVDQFGDKAGEGAVEERGEGRGRAEVATVTEQTVDAAVVAQRGVGQGELHEAGEGDAAALAGDHLGERSRQTHRRLLHARVGSQAARMPGC